jgi:hypothetical protein
MTRLNNLVLLRTANANAMTIFVVCALLITLGVTILMGGSNQPLYRIANAQLENSADLREEQRAAVLEEELLGKPNQNQIDQSAAPATGPDGISLRLDKAHFIPLSPISDSPGNQVKMLLDYTIEDPSAFADHPVSAVMEVYAENQTLLKTSSLPEPIVLDDSKGTIQLATTLGDHNLKNITARALLTDDQKVSPLSDPIEASLGLGEVRSTDSSGMK